MTREDVRKMREAAGFSVSEAARLVGVADRTWQRYEQGTRQMPAPVEELFRIKTAKK